MRIRAGLAACALACLACGTPAMAQGHQDPDWPCVQRKVERLSWGQIWSGPPLPENPRWRDDERLARLVPLLTARRTGLDEVKALVAELGATEPQGRDERLLRLFAGFFEQIDRERSELIRGITRYARNQQALSAMIDARRRELDELRAKTGEDDHDALDRIEELEDQIHWDTQIYERRRQSLTYVCESPVTLEKRAFAVARIIQAELGGD